MIDHLFASTIDVAVRPFFARAEDTRADSEPADAETLSGSVERLELGGSRGLQEVLHLQVRKAF